MIGDHRFQLFQVFPSSHPLNEGCWGVLGRIANTPNPLPSISWYCLYMVICFRLFEANELFGQLASSAPLFQLPGVRTKTLEFGKTTDDLCEKDLLEQSRTSEQVVFDHYALFSLIVERHKCQFAWTPLNIRLDAIRMAFPLIAILMMKALLRVKNWAFLLITDLRSRLADRATSLYNCCIKTVPPKRSSVLGNSNARFVSRKCIRLLSWISDPGSLRSSTSFEPECPGAVNGLCTVDYVWLCVECVDVCLDSLKSFADENFPNDDCFRMILIFRVEQLDLRIILDEHQRRSLRSSESGGLEDAERVKKATQISEKCSRQNLGDDAASLKTFLMVASIQRHPIQRRACSWDMWSWPYWAWMMLDLFIKS